MRKYDRGCAAARPGAVNAMKTEETFLPGDGVINDAKLVALYQLWLFKAGQRAMPARRDFLPGDMVRCLPHVILIDALGRPRGFRNRLLGTEIVARLGRDATGKMIDTQNYGAAARGIAHLFNLVCELQRPIAKRGVVFDRRHAGWIAGEALLMPLSANGTDVDMIFGGIVEYGMAAFQPPPPLDNMIWNEAFSCLNKGISTDPVIDGMTHLERLRNGLAGPAARTPEVRFGRQMLHG